MASPADASAPAAAAAEKPRARERAVAAALVTIPFAYAGYFAFTSKGGPTFFHWHPFLMLVAYATTSGVAVLAKKRGGAANTRLHGYLMFASSAAAVAGAWVMWKNKEMAKRAHLTTLHAQLGAVALTLSVPLPLIAWVALNPDSGVFRKSAFVRAAHKWGGRALLALAFVTMSSGVYKMDKNVVRQALMLGGLAAVAPFVLV